MTTTENKTMDICEIKAYLPHRYPLLLVDRVISYEENKCITAIKNVTVNEEFFNGHFPHKPVMPGVLMIEAMAQTAALLSFKSIDVKNFSVGGVVASLRLAGITGIVYVELDTKRPGEPALVPKDFTPDYPVIPSAPSDIKQIESSINDILKSMKEINFKGISDQVMQTTKSIDNLVNGEKLKRIMADAGKTASNLAAASDKLNRSLNDGSMDELLAEVRTAVKDARALVARIDTEIEGMKIRQTTGKINQFVEGTSRKVHSVLTEVELTSETLRRTAESLEGFIERLNQDPSALIFSSPPKGD